MQVEYKKLLEKDANLRRWYTNIRRDSISTAEVSLQRVGRVCKLFKTSPAKLAGMSVKNSTNFLLDLVTKLDEEGKQPGYIDNFVKVLKSWFKFNGIKIEQKIKIPDHAKEPSKVDQEQSPTPDQVRRVLNAADQKQKVESTLVGFSGLRLETVGDYLGEDGLKGKDLPEMEIDNDAKLVNFTKIPTLVIVRHNLSKAGYQYFTFYPDESCQYLKELLEFRMESGEKITPETPIVTSLKWHPHYLRKDSIEHITSRRVGTSMKKAIKKAGYDWRPYILRTYFDTRMMMAEADGIIIKDWRSFWMGHSGDIEAVYTVNKKRLPEDLVEKMRAAFAKAAERYLETTSKRNAATQDMVRAEMYKTVLEMAHFSPEEIDKLGDLSKLTAPDISKILEEREKTKLGLNGNSQKVVPMKELEQYITEGWEYVRDLPPR